MLKPGEVPLIGKKSNMRSLYRFSPESKKKTPEKKGVVITELSEPTLKRPKVTLKPFKATGSEKEKPKAVEKPIEKEIEKKGAADKPLLNPRRPRLPLPLLLRRRRVRRSFTPQGLTIPFMRKRKDRR
ncbi:hypothetical protein Hanom_Chr17g01571051 [Helianthus anomalus]